MRELLSFSFESGELPPGWLARSQNHSFEDGGMRTGRVTMADFVVPGAGWGRLRVEVQVQPIGGGIIVCDDHLYSMTADLGRHSHRIAFYSKALLASNRAAVPEEPGPRLVAFEFDHGHMRLLVGDEELVAADDPRPAPFTGLLQLAIWDDCLLYGVRVLGDEPAEAQQLPPRSARDLWLEVNVDFADDLLHAPFTEAMFDQLFGEFEDWGVRRCHWIYYGGTRHGWWDSACSGLAASNYHQTVANVGEVLDTAVAAAHAHGIELYGLIKPFDMGFWQSFGEGTPEALTRGKLQRVGGPVGWIADFCAEHRELMMCRKPDAWGPAHNEVFTRIDLVKGDDRPAAFGAEQVELWVSDDNASYRPYGGPIVREEVIEDYPLWEHTASGGRPTGGTRRCRVLRLSGLELGQRYFVLAVPGGAGSFANELINLVHAFGEHGEERLLTYGTMRRPTRVLAANATLVDLGSHFAECGIEFDCFPGTPSAVFPGFDAIRAEHALDSGEGLLAIARGKDRDTVAALSPSFPEARQWWLSWVRECLLAGVDGVELRVRNHHSPFAWGEFGFEEPVVRQFRERYGVDLLGTDDFDRAAWRRLRGEGYTEFYRQAKALVASRGKPLGLHVSPTLVMEPEQGAAMEVHFDWRTWLSEGLADSVTMKEVWPRTRLAEEVLSYTRPRGVPVVFCPYANTLWRGPGGEQAIADWIRLAREGGFDGYQLYECASVMRACAEGRVEMQQPDLGEVFRREFRRR